MAEKARQLCPVCGCVVEAAGYNKDGVTYCCESCTTNRECDCGCFDKVIKQKK